MFLAYVALGRRVPDRPSAQARCSIGQAQCPGNDEALAIIHGEPDLNACGDVGVEENSVWRHRNGGMYHIVGIASGQSSTSIPAMEGAPLVIYAAIGARTERRSLHARPLDEFLDGRFARDDGRGPAGRE